ncbi:MAG: hypothetical protein AB7K24_30035, partial [Gemmataceae bacterium]
EIEMLMSMSPEEVGPDLDVMQQQADKLVGILRGAMSDAAEGPESELVNMLVMQLTSTAAEFFLAMKSAYQDLDRIRAAQAEGAEVERRPVDECPDQLGPGLRQELLQRFPPRPHQPRKPKPISEESLWKSSEESLWKNQD